LNYENHYYTIPVQQRWLGKVVTSDRTECSDVNDKKEAVEVAYRSLNRQNVLVEPFTQPNTSDEVFKK
jgi:hypothetical protein